MKRRYFHSVRFLASLTLLACVAVCATTASNAQEKEKPFLTQQGICDDTEAMTRTKLLQEIEQSRQTWIDNYEAVKTPEQIAQYQRERRDAFRAALGPMWDRSAALNPEITGSGVKEKYRYENIIFQSCPNVYVTGVLFLPKEELFAPPYPTMLVLCGHSSNGKAFDLYQSIGILAAVNGIAAFVMDPIDQGERYQYLNADGKVVIQSVQAHNMVNAGAILVGRSAATFEVWDAMRALDYLSTREDIDSEKFGVCGTSGGGTQTAYVTTVDDRIKLSAPSCYICSIFDDLSHNLGPQDGEQNIFGQLKFGVDHADYLFLRAPIPMLMCCATQDFFNCDDGWRSYRYAARMYSRMNYSNRISIVEKDAEHGYSEEARVATVRLALRWFADRNDEIVEHDQPLLDDQEILSVKSGKGVMSLPNARRSYELNLDLARELAENRSTKWANISAEEAAKIVAERAAVRPENERAKAVVLASENDTTAFQTEEGIYLTARTNFGADEQFETLDLRISDLGRNSTPTNEAFKNDGAKTAAVELRGYGDTQARGRNYYSYEHFGTDGSDNCLAFLLGKSYIGMRVEDLLAVAQYYREKNGAKIALHAEGYACTVAMLAVIIAPELFESVELINQPPTWMEQMSQEYGPIQMTNTLFGALNDFDTDDLVSYLKRIGKLQVEE
ncbi:MAG: acetylxylan esterase [Planctomycetia bacterium]|nr:acetylxylan esterase [Planctomycetia bacterium]